MPGDSLTLAALATNTSFPTGIASVIGVPVMAGFTLATDQSRGRFRNV